MNAILFDTLKLSRTLRDKGHFSPEQADALAEALTEASQENLATKADIAGLKTEMKGDTAGLKTELKGDIAAVRAELKSDIADLRTQLKGDIEKLRVELKDDIAKLRTEVKGDIGELRTEIRTLEYRMTIKLGAMNVGLAGLLFAILKLVH